jgi:hypothetical protein
MGGGVRSAIAECDQARVSPDGVGGGIKSFGKQSFQGRSHEAEVS